MTDAMNEMQKLADELEAYTSRYSNDWAVANPTISWARLSLIVAALRAQAQGEPVAADAGAVATRETIARTIRAAMMPESAKQKHWSLLYKAADAILALLASPTAAGIATPRPAAWLCDHYRPDFSVETEIATPETEGAYPVYRTPPAASADAVSGALPEFEDPRVQVVYQTICQTPAPANEEEHWEGWVSRHIVAALTAPVAGDAGMRERAMQAIENMRIAGAGNFTDPRYAGQRGQDRADALYDAYQAVKALPASGEADAPASPPVTQEELDRASALKGTQP